MKTYEELLAERDALAAQIENLRSLFPLDCLLGCEGFLNYPIKKYNNVVDAFNSTPAKCLAEIKAEAGRAGFVAGAEMWCDCGVESQYKTDCLIGIEADADRYETKIRNTGTWLKDSNVNGGKRQGGAE